MSRYAIIIPAMNEASSLAGVLDDIACYHQCPVIVVDDGSDDDTAAVAASRGAVVLRHVMNMGAWRATQTGLRYALKFGYQRVVTMDADGQHKAKHIQTLLSSCADGNEVVIGSCTSRGSTGRHVAWRIFRLLTGLRVSDLTSGFRCYGNKAMLVLSSKQATMFEYQDVGVLLMVRNLRLPCTEIAVEMQERKNGISRIFHSWFAVSKYLLYTLMLSLTKAGPMSSKNLMKRLTSGESLE